MLTVSVNTVHTFTGPEVGSDGALPLTAPVVVGSTLYGTTSYGGTSGSRGTIYSVNADGTGYEVLHDFSMSGGDGFEPMGALALVGSTLYGTTTFGGAYGAGAVFSINTDGSDYQVLYSFEGSPSDGRGPEAGVIAVGSTLYGTTVGGGAYGVGSIFSINTDGTGYEVLHSFNQIDDVGSESESGLVAIGSTLYGTAEGTRGESAYGSVYSLNTDGSDFGIVYDFPDGGISDSTMATDGSVLYGVSYLSGTVFSLNADGTNYQVLHTFSGTDGSEPTGAMVLDGDTLFGTTWQGGEDDAGTIFSIGTDGSEFDSLYSFTGGSDGASPYAGLTLGGSALYGTGEDGGNHYDGTVFSVTGAASFITLTPSGTVADYTAGGPAVEVDPGITVASSDADLTGATATISAGTLQTGDTLTFTSPVGSGITGSYTGGVLTLSGTATVAQYQSALESIEFSNSTSTSTATRSISIVASDSSDSLTSNTAEETVDVEAPVTVTAAYVSGSSWSDSGATTNFEGYLAANGLGNATTPSLGYALQTGSAQLTDLPFANINTITVSFSGPVSNIGQGSLELVGGTGGGAVAAPSVTGFTTDGSNTYSWTLSGSLGNNKYVFAIATTGSSFGTAGSTQVTDANGAGISGTFTTSSSSFPSGNGLAGSTFDFNFNVLPGDGYQYGIVNSSDAAEARSLDNDHETSAGYNPYFDFYGNGLINTIDAAEATSENSTRQSGITAPSSPSASPAFDIIALALGVAETPAATQPSGQSAAVSGSGSSATSSGASAAPGAVSVQTADSTDSTPAWKAASGAHGRHVLAALDQAVAEFDREELPA
ncbi:MAG TPA: choice-of-anchor tandem repeat GloVer-containing protein [Pirellulales bacterium]|nr:choice-of-anchor tandem repeat GloVer-containing protein [Pirellulales bacterium]